MIFQLAVFVMILLASSFIYFKRYLTLAGSILTLTMAITFSLYGGLKWLIPPLTFFVFSTLWTKLLGISSEKDKTRKFVQVFANGGLALLLVVTAWFINIIDLPVLFVTVFAASSADTWATEFGGKFGGRPVSLRTFKMTQPGESGAITIWGTIASLAGSTTVSLSAFLANLVSPIEFFLISVSGLAASLFDSVLGAWVQVIWTNDKGIKKEELNNEDRITYKRHRGLSIVNNDGVNFLSTCFSVVVTILLIQYFR